MKTTALGKKRAIENPHNETSSAVKLKKKKTENAEMTECLDKLKTLVPSLSDKDKNLSQVDVVEEVISYIVELEETLQKRLMSETRRFPGVNQRIPLSESNQGINTDAKEG